MFLFCPNLSSQWKYGADLKGFFESDVPVLPVLTPPFPVQSVTTLSVMLGSHLVALDPNAYILCLILVLIAHSD